MDEQTDYTTDKLMRLSKHVCQSFDSAQKLAVAKNSRETCFCAQAFHGHTDRRTDRPSYRDAFPTPDGRIYKARGGMYTNVYE